MKQTQASLRVSIPAEDAGTIVFEAPWYLPRYLKSLLFQEEK